MADGVITATVVLSFRDDSSKEGVLKIDRDEDNETGFILFKSSNVSITMLVVSEGTLGGGGATVLEKEDDLQFSNTEEASLSYPPVSGLTVVRASPGISGTPTVVGTKATYSGKKIGIVRVKYDARGQKYNVGGVDKSFPILVYAEGVVS